MMGGDFLSAVGNFYGRNRAWLCKSYFMVYVANTVSALKFCDVGSRVICQ